MRPVGGSGRWLLVARWVCWWGGRVGRDTAVSVIREDVGLQCDEVEPLGTSWAPYHHVHRIDTFQQFGPRAAKLVVVVIHRWWEPSLGMLRDDIFAETSVGGEYAVKPDESGQGLWSQGRQGVHHDVGLDDTLGRAVPAWSREIENDVSIRVEVELCVRQRGLEDVPQQPVALLAVPGPDALAGPQVERIRSAPL